MQYRIANTRSWQDMGIYEADDEQGALDAMARDAGYADHAAACAEHPVADGELAVEAQPMAQHTMDRDEALAAIESAAAGAARRR